MANSRKQPEGTAPARRASVRRRSVSAPKQPDGSSASTVDTIATGNATSRQGSVTSTRSAPAATPPAVTANRRGSTRSRSRRGSIAAQAAKVHPRSSATPPHADDAFIPGTLVHRRNQVTARLRRSNELLADQLAVLKQQHATLQTSHNERDAAFEAVKQQHVEAASSLSSARSIADVQNARLNTQQRELQQAQRAAQDATATRARLEEQLTASQEKESVLQRQLTDLAEQLEDRKLQLSVQTELWDRALLVKTGLDNPDRFTKAPDLAVVLKDLKAVITRYRNDLLALMLDTRKEKINALKTPLPKQDHVTVDSAVKAVELHLGQQYKSDVQRLVEHKVAGLKATAYAEAHCQANAKHGEKLTKLQSDLQQLQAELQQSRQEAAHSSEQLSALQQAQLAERAELTRVQAELEDVKPKYTQWRNKANELEQRLQSSQPAQLAELTVKLQNAEAQMDIAHKAAARELERRKSAEQQLTTAQADLRTAQTSAATELDANLAKLRTTHKLVQAERDTAQRDVEAQRIEIEDLKKNAVDLANNHRQKLTEARSTSEQAATELLKKLKSAETARDTSVKAATDLRTKLQATEAARDTSVKAATELQNKLKATEAARDTNVKAVADLQTKLKAAETARNNSAQEATDKVKTLERGVRELTGQTQRQVFDLNLTITSLRNKLAEAESTSRAASKAKTSAETALQSANDKLQRESDAFQAQVSKLENDLERALMAAAAKPSATTAPKSTPALVSPSPLHMPTALPASGPDPPTVDDPASVPPPAPASSVTLKIRRDPANVTALLAALSTVTIKKEKAFTVLLHLGLAYRDRSTRQQLIDEFTPSTLHDARDDYAEKLKLDHGGIEFSNRLYVAGNANERMFWPTACAHPLQCIARSRCDCLGLDVEYV